MKIYYLFTLIIVLAIGACESIVDVKVNEVEPYLVVDAWLTREPGDQVIRLTTTQPYFKNDFAPGVTDAEVRVTDGSGNTYDFQEQGNGDYLWTSADTFGTVGESYFLEIAWDNNTYTSSTVLPRSVPIDSLVFNKGDEGDFGIDYYAEFFGDDPVGIGDAYWLRAWRNGKYLNKPSEIYLFYDASFSEGNGDGIPFIFPIRISPNTDEYDINMNRVQPYNPADTIYFDPEERIIKLYGSKCKVTSSEIKVILDENRKKPLDGGVSNYPLDGNPFFQLNDTTIVKKADSLYLELNTISPEAWFFLVRLQQETNRPVGFGALFATPPADLPTNIVCSNEDVSVAGFFNISGVSSFGRQISEQSIRVED